MVCQTSNARLLIESRMADALQGNAGACFDLGIALASGSCTRGELVEAHKWFSLASRAGYAPAAKSGARIEGRMCAADIAKARRRADHARLSAHLFS